ncbi:MAG: hypothetical protein ACLT8E_04335 [Akkermansia sp.]
MVSLAISMIFAAFVFDIPIRGSLILLLAVSALFLIVALGLGLVISTATKTSSWPASSPSWAPSCRRSCLRLPVRHPQHAPRRPGHHLHHPGPLLRHPAQTLFWPGTSPPSSFRGASRWASLPWCSWASPAPAPKSLE